MCDNTDEYEISDPYTIGGASGNYVIPCPYHTEGEWCVVSAMAGGTFGFVAPTLAVEEAPANFNVAAVAGPTTLMTGAGQLQSAVVTAAGTTNLTFQDAAGNVIATVVQPGTVGQEIQFNADFATSLVANNATTTPVVVVSVLKSGSVATAGTAAIPATFAIGSKNPTQPKLSTTGADSFGGLLTSGPDNNNALQSYVGALVVTAPFITYSGDAFMPLPSPAFVYLQVVAPVSTEVLVTVQFRRKLDRVIPDKPRAKPQTHGHVIGRMNHRSMMAGFAAQYPDESGQYQHQMLPEQDTEVMKRGILPLGPTTYSHRGTHVDRRNYGRHR